MSYQVVASPASINDIFGVLSTLLTANGFAVDRINESVNSDTCMTWNNGSTYFHLDYDSSAKYIISSMSTGYVAGTEGRLQAGAQSANYGDSNLFVDDRETVVVVTPTLIHIKQIFEYERFGGDTGFIVCNGILFNFGHVYSIGDCWISSQSCNDGLGASSFNNYISEVLEYSQLTNTSINNIIYSTGSGVFKVTSVFSDFLCAGVSTSGARQPQIDVSGDNLFSILLSNIYYSTFGVPLNVYKMETGLVKPILSFSDDIYIGRNDLLNKYDTTTINASTYLRMPNITAKPSSGNYSDDLLKYCIMVKV
ncbi:hypothetical protein [Francisella marina]|uniref:hypothetical protein n=1 Tax=Francisella marina TaxID=2249302 RepID=UPI0011EDA3C0|nr:hypothetical protein [Francisella marina]QEO58330.1 hypothetical protein F0R75_00535 [Francisella marina]